MAEARVVAEVPVVCLDPSSLVEVQYPEDSPVSEILLAIPGVPAYSDQILAAY
tara:strand:- start:152 stop:310 length:159 start_codon:yes stop_codon:yes gene_type:complete